LVRSTAAMLIVLPLARGPAEEAPLGEGLRGNAHTIAGPAPGQDRSEWLAALRAYRAGVRSGPPRLDRSIYDRADLAWMRRSITCHFTFLYDRSIYDPETGRYALDEFLDEGEREFGGYDILVLWQGYPRLGVDPRNQFDMYRDLPGGLPGLREIAKKAHRRGVRIFVDYNPWDRATRREGRSDEEALADLVAGMDADGIFLDTLSAASPGLRARIDAARPGVVLASEIHPPIAQLSLLSSSWAQWLEDPHPPGLLHLKWIEPRHMQHQIRRWDRDHSAEIEAAFFGGSGVLVWENIFGAYNPWPRENRRAWRRASRILRAAGDLVSSESWDPFVPTLQPTLFAHRWPGDGVTLFTLLNRGPPLEDRPLLDVALPEGARFFDLHGGRHLAAAREDGAWRITGSVRRLGAILAVQSAQDPAWLAPLLAAQSRDADDPAGEDARNRARSLARPRPVERTSPAEHDRPPPGMVLVPGGELRMRLEHRRRECGCYPDPSLPEAEHARFTWGHPHAEIIRHDIGPIRVEPFFIDEAEVTNEQYRRFLEASGYRPRHPESFLRHWPGGRMPAEVAELPVVYVDLDDARAYAAWAGKRLPTEEEWHLAAQGFDGRAWPWGEAFSAERCNTTGDRLLPARSLPSGRSPWGCFHMAGNAWEWTESERDDGHTRFVIIRGGSYFRAEGSIWYVEGGPRPCSHHAKFLLLWPGLDRCATIGFRCVRDVR
ncbi:MAG: SUMF1/EgtB/PvdO family nonheme iron enzyme, partial [Planctomycetes bacterium]|nr:SUMF1/EgtB/PvdO family nonheme iron enzyme [Planctomycetota bacterium]